MTPTAKDRERALYALGPWAERPVDSTAKTREELIQNVAQALAEQREDEQKRMERLMDSIDTCPCDVCVDSEPTNINRFLPHRPPTPASEQE